MEQIFLFGERWNVPFNSASLNGTFQLSPHKNICTVALINICYLYTNSPDSRSSCHSSRIWNSIAYFPDVTVQYRLKNLWMGCIKQTLTALLFREWQKIIVPSVKLNPGLLFTSALCVSVNSRPGLSFTSGQQFSTFPSWAVNICTPINSTCLVLRLPHSTHSFPAYVCFEAR